MSLSLDIEHRFEPFTLQIQAELPTSGITAVCGPSGSGKTTLMRCIAGLERRARGTIRFNGNTWQSTAGFTPPEQRGIGYVFQDSRLFPHLSVEGNLQFALRRRRSGRGDSLSDIASALGITSLLTQRVDTLSGGECKRVAIARALLGNPQLLIMDEPLTGLHEQALHSLLQLLYRLPSRIGVPVLYVSHSFEEVSQLAETVLWLERGRVQAQDSVLALSQDLRSPLTHRPEAASILRGHVGRHDADYDLSYIELGNDVGLWLTGQRHALGQAVNVQVPTRDISLALSHADDSSILNILPCEVDSIEDSELPQLLVRLRVGEQFLLARITRKSLDRLQLHVGQRVYAQVKSVALLNARELNGG